MKDLLKYLPQLIEFLPKISKFLPTLLVVISLGGVGYLIYLFYTEMPPLYRCYNNHMYELKWGSKVYTFVGDTCVEFEQ